MASPTLPERPGHRLSRASLVAIMCAIAALLPTCGESSRLENDRGKGLPMVEALPGWSLIPPSEPGRFLFATGHREAPETGDWRGEWQAAHARAQDALHDRATAILAAVWDTILADTPEPRRALLAQLREDVMRDLPRQAVMRAERLDGAVALDEERGVVLAVSLLRTAMPPIASALNERLNLLAPDLVPAAERTIPALLARLRDAQTRLHGNDPYTELPPATATETARQP